MFLAALFIMILCLSLSDLFHLVCAQSCFILCSFMDCRQGSKLKVYQQVNEEDVVCVCVCVCVCIHIYMYIYMYI